MTATAVTIAFAQGEVGWLCFGMVLYTDYLWIPLFLYYDVITRGGTDETNAMAEAQQAA